MAFFAEKENEENEENHEDGTSSDPIIHPVPPPTTVEFEEKSLLKNRISVFSYRTKRQKRRSGEPPVRKATPA